MTTTSRRPAGAAKASAIYDKAIELADTRFLWLPAWVASPRANAPGRRFWIIPASDETNREREEKGLPPAAHWTAVDGSGCTCEYQRRRRAGAGPCSHALAAQIVADEQARALDGDGLASEEEVDQLAAEIATCRRCGSAPRVGLSKFCNDCAEALKLASDRLYPPEEN